MENTNEDSIDKKPFPTESDPLLPQAGSSSAPENHPDRPRTVRHHRRTLSGRSIRGRHIQFGPSFRPNIYPAVNDPFSRQSKRAADRRARSRFFKALITGVGLWLVIGLVLGWTGLRRSNWGHDDNRLDYGAKPSVPQSEGHPVTCAKFSAPEATTNGFSRMPGKAQKSKASFKFFLPEGPSFFIHGQGSFAKGQIHIEAAQSDSVKIEVEALYNDEALIDLMTVCQVEADGPPAVLGTEKDEEASGRYRNRKIGLGIYTPSPEVGPYPNSDLEFRVRVKLPSHLKSIYAIEIKGDLFAVVAKDLSSIPISQFDVESTVASVSIEKLFSHSIRIRTHNGQIEGLFNISKSLSLTTVNGAITSKVALFPQTKEDKDLPDLPPNKPIDDPGSDSSPPARNATSSSSTSVHITTINGAANVDYVQHPLNMKLFSYVASTNGRAQVKHTPNYEGDFEVETTWGSIDIRGPSSNDDPSGRGRDRIKVIDNDRDELGYRQISGSIWWGDKDGNGRKPEKGDSVVKTTLGSARIIFD